LSTVTAIATPRRRALAHSAVPALLILPLIVVIFALVIWPTVQLAINSGTVSTDFIGGGQSASGWSWQNYRVIITDSLYREALVNSIGLSFLVAVTSIILCLGPAWLLARKAFFGKRLVRALFALPMSFSGIIIGFVAIIMLGRIGFVPQMLAMLVGKDWLSGVAYQFAGLMIAYVYFEIPRATLSLETALAKFNGQLEAAAQVLGAHRWQRWAWVVLPLIWPALLSTFAITFSVSLGSFGVALVVSKRFALLPVELFQQLFGFLNLGLAAAMGIVLMLIAFVVNYSLRTTAEYLAGERA
jgi:putative spermidine/putrescine transport system permease protein